MAIAGWVIRPAASTRDWDEALALLVTVYVDGAFSSADAARELFARRRIDGQGEFLVAAAPDSAILGAVLLVDERSALRQVARAGEAEFRLLGVSDRARGHGIGRALGEACPRRARRAGATRMVLSTQPAMRAAHRVYEDLGFTRETARDWQTEGGSPRWVYAVALGAPTDVGEREGGIL
jgi:GNAT superfamily N-acetyltransferase